MGWNDCQEELKSLAEYNERMASQELSAVVYNVVSKSRVKVRILKSLLKTSN